MLTLQALHDEIENDPESVGYKEAGGAWKGDQVIADLLNDPANGAPIFRLAVSPQEIVSSIPIGEYRTYSQAERDWLRTLLGHGGSALVGGTIDASDNVVRGNLLALMPAGSVARDNLIAKVQRQGSRAEVLWGEGTTVTVSNVGEAANL